MSKKRLFHAMVLIICKRRHVNGGHYLIMSLRNLSTNDDNANCKTLRRLSMIYIQMQNNHKVPSRIHIHPPTIILSLLWRTLSLEVQP